MGRKKKGSQTLIPGSDIDVIASIETAAEAYKEARDTRQQCTEAEVAAKEELDAAMKMHKLKRYVTKKLAENLEITITVEKEKITVKAVKEKESGVLDVKNALPADGDDADNE